VFVSSQGADQCDACRHVRDGPYCVAECPSSKYVEANGTCSPCHEHCAEGAGCTGPLDEVGPGACNACAVVRFDDVERTGEIPVARCLPADVDCGDGFYRGQVPLEFRRLGIGKQVGNSSTMFTVLSSRCLRFTKDTREVTDRGNDRISLFLSVPTIRGLRWKQTVFNFSYRGK